MILKTKEKKITIVTAIHTARQNNNDREKSIKISTEKIKILLDKLNNNKIITNIRSSDDPDEDFIYLCTAKKLLITGQSGFGICAKKINAYIKKHKLL